MKGRRAVGGHLEPARGRSSARKRDDGREERSSPARATAGAAQARAARSGRERPSRPRRSAAGSDATCSGAPPACRCQLSSTSTSRPADAVEDEQQVGLQKQDAPDVPGVRAVAVVRGADVVDRPVRGRRFDDGRVAASPEMRPERLGLRPPSTTTVLCAAVTRYSSRPCSRGTSPFRCREGASRFRHRRDGERVGVAVCRDAPYPSSPTSKTTRTCRPSQHGIPALEQARLRTWAASG